MNPLTYYGDRNDRMETDSIQKVMDDSLALENEIWENSLDWICDCETELICQLKTNFVELEEYDTQELREYFLDYIQHEMDFVGSALKQTPNPRIRVEVSCTGEYDCVDVEKILESGNSELERFLKLVHGKTKCSYYNDIAKLLKGKFTLKSMVSELQNCTTEWCGFIFYFRTLATDLVDFNQKKWKKIKIPKHAMCGFFNSEHGSGSLLEVELTEDIWVKRYRGKKLQLRVLVDEHTSNRYGVEEVYGLCDVPFVKLETK